MEPGGIPFYYASLCGFRDLAAHLNDEHPEYVIAPGGINLAPLVAALQSDTPALQNYSTSAVQLWTLGFTNIKPHFVLHLWKDLLTS